MKMKISNSIYTPKNLENLSSEIKKLLAEKKDSKKNSIFSFSKKILNTKDDKKWPMKSGF